MRKYGLLLALLASCSTAPKTVVQTSHVNTPLEQFVEYRREQVGPAPDNTLPEYECSPTGRDLARLDDSVHRDDAHLLAVIRQRFGADGASGIIHRFQFETPADYLNAIETIQGNAAIIEFTRLSGLPPVNMVKVQGVWKFNYRSDGEVGFNVRLTMFKHNAAFNDVADRIEAGKLNDLTEVKHAIVRAQAY